MSDTQVDLVAQEALILELFTLISPRQWVMILGFLREIRRRGHGEITLRMSGDRLYIMPAPSYDAGCLPKFPAEPLE